MSADFSPQPCSVPLKLPIYQGSDPEFEKIDTQEDTHLGSRRPDFVENDTEKPHPASRAGDLFSGYIRRFCVSPYLCVMFYTNCGRTWLWKDTPFAEVIGCHRWCKTQACLFLCRLRPGSVCQPEGKGKKRKLLTK